MPWPHEDGVMTISTTEVDAIMVCRDCSWPLDEFVPSLSAARKRAHRHIAANPAHTVDVEARREYAYAADTRKR